MSRETEVIMELVRLKDLKDEDEREEHTPMIELERKYGSSNAWLDASEQRIAEYERRKPAAWAAARELIAEGETSDAAASPEVPTTTLSTQEAQAESHTDHPLRHYDRTCPACNPSPSILDAARELANGLHLDGTEGCEGCIRAAAYITFIAGADIPETIEHARAALVLRAERAEQALKSAPSPSPRDEVIEECAKVAERHFIYGHSVAGPHFAKAGADEIRKLKSHQPSGGEKA